MNKFELVTDTLYNDKLKKEINIIHVSDIHFNTDMKVSELDKLKEYIISLKGDYLMITGDIIDTPEITKSDKIGELQEFLISLAKDIKIIISLGNHDIKVSSDLLFFDEFNKLDNIYVLNNSEYNDEYIHVVGLTLPYMYYHDHYEDPELLKEVLKENNRLLGKNNKYNILMIHSPIRLPKVLDKIANFDLVLSGHTHNGMVPKLLYFMFPKNRGLVSPNKKLFPEISKGKIINNGTFIIINGAYKKLSLCSGKILSIFNFVYNKSINKIVVRRN